MKKVIINGDSLKLAVVHQIATNPAIKIELSAKAKNNIKKTRVLLEKAIANHQVIYGVNTGFGKLVDVKIDDQDLIQLQKNLVRSHAAGVGDYFSDELVRAIMLIRINSLAKGYSGISLQPIELLIKMLNKGICPRIPSQGSVGASGDLAPLAHLALPVMGEGKVSFKGKIMSAKQALTKAKLKACQLKAKEGLSLINGTQAIAGIMAYNLTKIEKLLKISDIAAAVSCEALKGTNAAFKEKIQKVRGQVGQIQAAKNLMKILKASQILKSHKACKRTQDAYSLRCVPQVHGAVKDVYGQARKITEIEINAATDNPLVFADTNEFISGGNFHAEPLALWADFLAIALTDLGNIAERRIERLVNPALSELPVAKW